MNIIRNKLKVVKKILDQEIVVIFSGHSEWGARALGNRSCFLTQEIQMQKK